MYISLTFTKNYPMPISPYEILCRLGSTSHWQTGWGTMARWPPGSTSVHDHFSNDDRKDVLWFCPRSLSCVVFATSH